MTETFQVRDIAKKTGIHSELVREYSRALEINGYKIARTPEGMRQYTEEDIHMLKAISEEKVRTSGDVQEIAAYVMKKKHGPKNIEQKKRMVDLAWQVEMLTRQNEEFRQINEYLLKKQKQQGEELRDLIRDLEKQAARRDEQLIRLIRETQEMKRYLASGKLGRLLALFR